MKTIQEIIQEKLNEYPDSKELFINDYYLLFDFSMFDLSIKYSVLIPKDTFLLCNKSIDDTLRYLLEPYVSPEDYKITY